MKVHPKFPIPLSYFSVPLGLMALGLSWRYGANVGMIPSWVGESWLAVALVIWLLLMVAYGVKWVAYRDDFLSDWRDLVQCCFISAIPITTILAGMVIYPYGRALACVLVFLGVVGQLAFAMYRAAGLWRGLHSIEATTPIIYLPTVATNFVSATALAMLGWVDYAWVFWGAGVFSWLSLESAILHRLRTQTAIAPPVRGIVGVQLAPAFVCCGAYLAINHHQVDHFVLMLVGYGTLQFLFLIRLMRWLFEAGFVMSFWGFSFGLASMVGCGFHLLANNQLVILAYALVSVGSLLVVGLVMGTVVLMLKGRLWVKSIL